MTAVLETLLDANVRFALQAKGTTNHCPMALAALCAMGASDQRLRDFYAHWEHQYAILEAPSDTEIARNTWSAHLGQREQFQALRRCFEAWLAEAGTAAVVAAILTEIPAAPATIAFHAWIRLAYGIESAHRGEIAAGLAALVVGHLPIAVSMEGRSCAASVEAGLAHLSQRCGGLRFEGNSITARLRAVAQEPRFIDAVELAPKDQSLLDSLARAALAAYWQTENFTVLHMVTATHAARRIVEMLPDARARQLEHALWLAFCAAYVSVGAPQLGGPVEIRADLPSWQALCASAIESNDDHVIKLTYTCWREAQRNPLPLYRQVAARALGK